MKKTKRIEAWAWVRPDSTIISLHPDKDDSRRNQPFMHQSNGYRLIRLTEADPLQQERDAVVRAAVRWVAQDRTWASNPTAKSLALAVARLKKSDCKP